MNLENLLAKIKNLILDRMGGDILLKNGNKLRAHGL